MSKNILMPYKLAVLALLFTMAGCTVALPRYQPDINLANEMKDLELTTKMGTGDFKAANEYVNEITLRGSALVSPYSKSYLQYMKKAIKEQLRQADLWNAKAPIVISGELIKNEVDPAISAGTADLSALFVVHKDGNEVYRKTHTIHHEWPSSFMGAVAIPNAAANYATSVQKLLSAFFLDKELLTALTQ